uniref:Uncharacterized protein n=1 Tax=Rhizophora mucronata TaxID=61149 RepID=A0A2P2K7B6_RHIMU
MILNDRNFKKIKTGELNLN